jgi:hypothetical protein
MTRLRTKEKVREISMQHPLIEIESMDEDILNKVIADITGSLPMPNESNNDDEDDDAVTAPESQYTLGPLGEGGVLNAWHNAVNHVLPSTANLQQTSGGQGPNPAIVDTTWFEGFTDKRKGMGVKVSAEYIHPMSHHSGQRHDLVHGSVLAEYVEMSTGVAMFIVDFGGGYEESHISQEQCIFQIGEAPSVGGHIGDCISRGEVQGLFGNAMYTDSPMPTNYLLLDMSDAYNGDGQTELLGANTPVQGAMPIEAGEVNPFQSSRWLRAHG